MTGGASHGRAPKLIYLVEDDRGVAQVVVEALGRFGFRVEHMRSGRQLLLRQRQRPADLCIVDLGLPDLDGLSVVRELGALESCAIVILSGRQDLADRVAGLELGADDYVLKPFEPRELIARVRSVLRRADIRRRRVETEIARFAGWAFEPASHLLTAPGGSAEQLGTAEAELLLALLRSPNRILTREQLLPDRPNVPYDRTIDARISRLRRRLRDDPLAPRLIKTIYGAGYMLAVPVAWAAKPDDSGPA
jgi:DNA-binding response OmpR family regulator